MNWETIGIASQVASAIAIVVTLAYFASQNRQSNIAAATGTTIKGTELASHWRSMLINNAARNVRKLFDPRRIITFVGNPHNPVT